MSGFGVEPDMTFATLLDEKLDAVLTGRPAAPGDELAADLALMVERLEEAFPAAVVSEHTEDVHIDRILTIAADVPAPVFEPVVSQGAGLLDRMRASLGRRVAAVILAFTGALGGAAYADVLPEPVQRAAANVAAAVGFDLPHPDDRIRRSPSDAVRLPGPDRSDDFDGTSDEDVRGPADASGALLAADDEDEAGDGDDSDEREDDDDRDFDGRDDDAGKDASDDRDADGRGDDDGEDRWDGDDSEEDSDEGDSDDDDSAGDDAYDDDAPDRDEPENDEEDEVDVDESGDSDDVDDPDGRDGSDEDRDDAEDIDEPSGSARDSDDLDADELDD